MPSRRLLTAWCRQLASLVVLPAITACVLGASVVIFGAKRAHRRDAEVAEKTQSSFPDTLQGGEGTYHNQAHHCFTPRSSYDTPCISLTSGQWSQLSSS